MAQIWAEIGERQSKSEVCVGFICTQSVISSLSAMFNASLVIGLVCRKQKVCLSTFSTCLLEKILNFNLFHFVGKLSFNLTFTF